MMIILQEANTPKCMVTSFLLKTLAQLVKKMRESELINQEHSNFAICSSA